MNPVLEEVLRHYDKTATQRDELLDLLVYAYENPRAMELNSGFIDEVRAAIAKAEEGVRSVI